MKHRDINGKFSSWLAFIGGNQILSHQMFPTIGERVYSWPHAIGTRHERHQVFPEERFEYIRDWSTCKVA